MLKKVCEGIWTCDADLSLFGAELGARMTLIDLDGKGSLFVHSPIRINEELQSAIDSIGRVKYVVAPNKWHHLFIPDLKKKYPQAKFFGAPGLDKKKPDFIFDQMITREQGFPWNSRLQHLLVQGSPLFNEVVFFDPETKTLLLTDLALHICETKSIYTKFVLMALGSFKKFGWSNIEKWLYVRGRKLFRKSIEEIIELDFDRVLLSHGLPVETGGKAIFQKAFLENHGRDL